jgi:putative phosphoribosyl transferase
MIARPPEKAARFRDRHEAGRALAAQLRKYSGREDVIVLALPRGGVPVGYEVARELLVPLDVFIVRKLGVPGFEEFAMGAIASGGVRVLNESVIGQLPHPEQMLAFVTATEMRELERREEEYRGKDGRAPDLRGKTVILVDDGLATGATMRAAVMALKQCGVVRLVVAVPVSAPETCAEFRGDVDEIVCTMTPQDFHAVGQFYEDFSQTTDEEVRELLVRAAAGRAER